MKLFRFEVRKLLLNKRTLTILAVLFAFYCVVGFGMSVASFGGLGNYSTYSDLANAAVGSYNEEQAGLSNAAYDVALNRYGNASVIMKMSSQDPQLKFDAAYHDYANSVNEYWNGPMHQDLENLKGIYPIQQRLSELEAEGATDSYEYKKITTQLERELAAGEPEFQNVALWESLFGVWGGIVVVILLFFPISFIVSSVYTTEKTTGMDNIILSSKNGQAQIVISKICAVAVTCVVTTLLYYGGTFIGTFLPFGTLAGISQPMRTISSLATSQLGMSIGSFAVLTVVWVLFVAIVYSIILTFVSSKQKGQAAVFGIGIVILLVNVLVNALGTSIKEALDIFIKFGFVNTANASNIFGGITTFNIFGAVVPYYTVAIIVLLVVGVLALFGIRVSQKYRTVA